MVYYWKWKSLSRLRVHTSHNTALVFRVMYLWCQVQRMLQVLTEKFPEKLKDRYKLEEIPADMTTNMLLETIGRKRGCIIAGGEVDILRTSVMLLDEFRGGKIGNISLESPEEF